MSTTSLDVAYAQMQRHSDAIVSGERERLLRVQWACLSDDSAVLVHQLSHQTRHNNALKHWLREAEKAYSEVIQYHEDRNVAVGAKSRAIKAYQVELQSLRAASRDATRILSEKLALARQLSVLKVENDHLRANSQSVETLQSDKLSLQRELNCVRVELETEKRSLQRAMSKDEARLAAEAQLKTKTDILEVELDQEKSSRQRQETEARIYREEADAQKALLESKLESLRDKLKATRAQLRSSQQVQKSTDPQLHQPEDVLVSEKTRKRKRPEISGNIELEAKERARTTKDTKRISTLLGDKSLFSMTPFLNKTALGDFQTQSPIAREDADKDAHENRTSIPSSPVTRSKPSAETAWEAGRENRYGAPRVNKKVMGRLDQVREEGFEGAAKKISAEQKLKDSDERSRLQAPPLLKKRRLLGRSRTNFGLESEELQPTKAEGIQGSGFESWRYANGVTNKNRQGVLRTAAFSPLKKDRKL